jgi:eukaryotic-like serine/threonine-protein kinase
MDSQASKEVVDFLTTQQIIEPSLLEEVPDFTKQFATAEEATNELVRLGKLTHFQQSHLLSGQREKLIFGPYRLLESLGEGGMGKVFKARHPRLDRLVALKFIHPDYLESRTQVINRFHREARAIAQLRHPNVVLLYDADEIEGTPYIAMEFVDGLSLAIMVRRNGPLGIIQSCEYMRQTALGLQHAFECGLVHRDIKPSNIVVSPQKKVTVQPTWKGLSLISIHDRNRMLDSGNSARSDTIKILDMGLALLKDSLKGRANDTALTSTGAMLGTPDYIAPEQARDARNVDIRADLYSLGCTFYHILSGQMPFPEGSPIEKALKHQLDEPPALETLRSNIPPKIAGIIQKLMAKKPDDRFQTPQELADVLAGIVALPEPESASRSDEDKPTRPTIPSMVQAPPRAAAHPEPADKPADRRTPSVEGNADKSRSVGAPMFANTLIPSDNFSLGDEPPATGGDPETVGNIITNLSKSADCEPVSKIAAHAGIVSAVAVAPNGKFAATADLNGRIRVWDLAKSKPREIASVNRPTEIQAIAFDPNESTRIVFGELLKGKAALICWDWNCNTFLDWGDFTTLDQSGVGCLRFTPDGAMLAAGVGSLAATWKIERGNATARKQHKGQASPIRAIALSPDHLLLATAGQHDSLLFWDLGKRRSNRDAGLHAKSRVASITTMSFSPDSKMLAMAGLDPEIVLWDLAGSTDDAVRMLSGHASNLLLIQFIGDGSELVSVAADGQVYFWDVRSGTISRKHNLNLNMAYRVALSVDATRVVVGFSNGTVAFCNLPPAIPVASGAALPYGLAYV